MNKITILPDVALSEIEGEPRVRDLDLADRLGFDRPRDIRKLVERNMLEIRDFGVCATVAQTSGARGGRPSTEYWLNEEQALLVSSLSDAPRAAEVRSMLIRVFVAYRRGHLVPSIDHGKIGRQVAAIVDDKLSAFALTVIPRMLEAEMAKAHLLVRKGKTAGEVWTKHGLPRLKNGARWLGNRLSEMGAAMPGRAEQGGRVARLFDPDLADACMRNGLHHKAKVYVSERMGQSRLKLVPTA